MVKKRGIKRTIQRQQVPAAENETPVEEKVTMRYSFSLLESMLQEADTEPLYIALLYSMK